MFNANNVCQIDNQNKSNSLVFRGLRAWRQAILDSFLPVGYPHSVSEDYLAYQTYDSLQAFFSTITSLLANRALLEGLGVGDANSSATSAMLLTILKDAMSRIATIVFAHRFGLRIEPDAKKYRFLADLFNDTAFFLELYSPYLDSYGKVLALSTGEALRALCGVAAGASKAALSVHFAKHDNLAELNAKEASQETAVGLVGLLVGTLVVKYVEDHTSVVCLMIALVFGHLWVNYLGVCSVYMDTFNRQRATILFQRFLQTGQVMSPKDVAKEENVLFWEPTLRNYNGQKVARIEIATDYKQASFEAKGTKTYLVDGSKYTLAINTRLSTGFTTIRILLWDRATPRYTILAWFLAVEIAFVLDAGQGYCDRIDRVVHGQTGDGLEGIGKLPEFKGKFCQGEMWKKIGALGWSIESQAFETGPPVRLKSPVGRAQV